ncbi:low molecular weight protein-tyrosine-phosphatase [Paraburkholderia sp.]|uniref:low molecular weight protein-tyrosine-phosphatase n=1 Tax=Paraburkholderia sp. TaxID=1926495 RepID=UPI002384408D|nr:low molecular weight protein-tyrosine-phosphatase [Paraburkholderia sp.]MDE1180420.1 low molecular weight phosphotyrosine protein phosphatase [Paraburkholderia sp.]
MIGNILVVCEGNVCRSPMAAALLAVALPGRSVASAGFNALVGVPAMQFAQEVMRTRGLQLDAHRGRQLSRAACVEADLILVMDRIQRTLLEEQYPFARGKIFRLGEYKNFDIHDPYRQPRFVFERCARLIELGVGDWLERLRRV